MKQYADSKSSITDAEDPSKAVKETSGPLAHAARGVIARGMSRLSGVNSPRTMEADSIRSDVGLKKKQVFEPFKADFHDISKRIQAKRKPVFHNAHQVELAVRFIRNNPTDGEALSMIRDLFDMGIHQFPRSCSLRLIYSRYVDLYWPENLKHEQHSALVLKAVSLRPSFDERSEPNLLLSSFNYTL
jgi:hypothetical protein